MRGRRGFGEQHWEVVFPPNPPQRPFYSHQGFFSSSPTDELTEGRNMEIGKKLFPTCLLTCVK